MSAVLFTETSFILLCFVHFQHKVQILNNVLIFKWNVYSQQRAFCSRRLFMAVR